MTIDAFVHIMDRIRVRDGKVVEFPILHAEAKCTIFLLRDDSRRFPITLGQLDGLCGERFISVLLNELVALGTGVV